MTKPDLEEIKALLERAGFTHLLADEVAENDDGIEPGWRVHDLPPDTVFAMFLADGLDEGQAKLIAAAVNALPSLLARIEALEAALKPFASAVDDLEEWDEDKAHIWEQATALNITVGDLRRARTALGGSDD